MSRDRIEKCAQCRKPVKIVTMGSKSIRRDAQGISGATLTGETGFPKVEDWHTVYPKHECGER